MELTQLELQEQSDTLSKEHPEKAAHPEQLQVVRMKQQVRRLVNLTGLCPQMVQVRNRRRVVDLKGQQ